MRDYKKTKIPKRFWHLTLDDYSVAGVETQRTRQAVEEYVADIKTHREWGTGLTLVGPPGTGKTMLACIIGLRAADMGYSVMYVPLATYQSHLRNLIRWDKTTNLDRREHWENIQDLVLTVRNKVEFLILDDVGKEHATDSRFVEDEFDFLVRRRYDLTLPTILTTNRHPVDWVTKYSEAMESFSHEAFPPIDLDVPDYRKR